MSIANRLKSYHPYHFSASSTEVQAEKTSLSQAVPTFPSNKDKDKPRMEAFINNLVSRDKIVVDNTDSVINIRFGHYDPRLLPPPIPQRKEKQQPKTRNCIKKSKSAFNIQELKTKKFIQKRELSLHSRQNIQRNANEKELQHKLSFTNSNLTETLAQCHRARTQSPDQKLQRLYSPPIEAMDISDFKMINQIRQTRNKNRNKKRNKMLQCDSYSFNNKSISQTKQLATANDLHIQTWVSSTHNWQKSIDKKREEHRKFIEDLAMTEEKSFFTPNTALSKHNSMSYLNQSKNQLRRSNSVKIHNRLYDYGIHIQSNMQRLVQKHTPPFAPTLYNPRKSTKTNQCYKYPIKAPPQVFSYKLIKQKQIEAKLRRERNLVFSKKKQRNNDKGTQQQEILLKSKELVKKNSAQYIRTLLDELTSTDSSKKRGRYFPGEDLYRINIKNTSSCEMEVNTLYPPKRSNFLAKVIH